MSSRAGWVRRGLGAALLGVSVLPIHRVLDSPATGPAGSATVTVADDTQALVWWSLLLVVGVSVVLGRVARGLDPASPFERLRPILSSLSTDRGLVALGATAACLAGAISRLVFLGLPTALDEMAHLLHARFMAGGALAGPAPEPAAAWIIQNTLVTEAGWASQYPPLHTAVLALGLASGAVWLVGPVLTGVMVLFAGLAVRRLLGDRPTTVGVAILAVAASPFVLFLGAGYLSHVTAGALAAVGMWAGLRARDGRAPWAVLAGLAAGALVAARPWTGLTLSAVFAFWVWVPTAVRHRDPGWLAVRLGAALAGSVLPGLWLAWVNVRLYGGPFTFGYGVLQGPRHGLGWHTDPWGNSYGPLEALGYTASDLLHLGVTLFETPIPALVAVGAYLMVASRLRQGESLLALWALIPVVANAFYWHHGQHLGPRMLYESAAPWAVLTVVSVAGLLRKASAGWLGRSVRWAVVLSVAGALSLGIPGRLASYGWSFGTLERIRVPPGSDNGLVFVHGAWSGRLSAELAGLGMRLDSVETAIRRNDTCRVQRFLDVWSTSRDRRKAETTVPLDFEPLPGIPRELRLVEVAPGSTVRGAPQTPPTPSCQASARSDRFGAVELAPLLWQGDLPGDLTGRPVFVRDLGPRGNRALLRRLADRPAFLFGARDESGRPALMPYEAGVRLLWEDSGDP